MIKLFIPESSKEHNNCQKHRRTNTNSRIGATCFYVIFGILFFHICYMFVKFGLNVREMADARKHVYPDGLNDDFIRTLLQSDPILVNHIRKYYLDPPNSRTTPYNLDYPDIVEPAQDPPLADIVRNYLGPKRNGFFVEAGAYDGELVSNTLRLEKDYNWTGLLVEPNPIAVKSLRGKKRKSWLLRGCLHPGTRPNRFQIHPAGVCGSMNWDQTQTLMKIIILNLFYPIASSDVWCFPLYSALLAVNQTKIDYMSLDFEGGELEILKNLPWDKLDINVIQIEYSVFSSTLFDGRRSAVKRDRILEYMRRYRTEYELLVDYIGHPSRDFVFVKRVP